MSQGQWISEFGRDYRVPKTLDTMVDRGELEELSWHNDVAPSYGIQTNLGFEVRIWANHPDPQERETGPRTPRFVVNVDDSGASPGGPRMPRRDLTGHGFSDVRAAIKEWRHLVRKYSADPKR